MILLNKRFLVYCYWRNFNQSQHLIFLHNLFCLSHWHKPQGNMVAFGRVCLTVSSNMVGFGRLAQNPCIWNSDGIFGPLTFLPVWGSITQFDHEVLHDHYGLLLLLLLLSTLVKDRNIPDTHWSMRTRIWKCRSLGPLSSKLRSKVISKATSSLMGNFKRDSLRLSPQYWY